MSRINAQWLTDAMLRALDITRATVDLSTRPAVASTMLLLKWASDQPGRLHVPRRARWDYITEHANSSPGVTLRQAFDALAIENHEILDGVLQELDFTWKVGPHETRRLIYHFDKISLADDNLAFPDVVGTAYDRLLGLLADAAGQRDQLPYTSRSALQLMSALADPDEYQSVYDPFAGSAGTLIQARQYLQEQGKDVGTLKLFGQEVNRLAWSLARLNLLFHGARDASLLRGNTLTSPLHLSDDGRRLISFDRAVTVLPLATSFSPQDIDFPERMKYGPSTAGAHKTEFACIQHVLATLAAHGVGVVAAPHGVLFRGGVDSRIRQGLIKENRVDTVIGMGSSIFRGTTVPACILVLRGTEKPLNEADGVLFIDAEQDIVATRSRSQVEPRHMEKILRVFRNRSELPGFSHIASFDEIASNSFDLNIGRYVRKPSQSRERTDPQALLTGGVPADSVDLHVERFDAFGVNVMELFRARGDGRLDFLPEGYKSTAEEIPKLTAAREKMLADCAHIWWRKSAEPKIRALTTAEKPLRASRNILATGFDRALAPLGILDEYQLAGVFADWWAHQQEGIHELDREAIPRSAGERDDFLARAGRDLVQHTEQLAAVERQRLVDIYLAWGDLYATSLLDLAVELQTGASQLRSCLADLGYPWPYA